MFSVYIWIKIRHLTLISCLHYLKMCISYLHLLYNLTTKYGIFEQASHAEQVVDGHCGRVHVVCLKRTPLTAMHALSILRSIAASIMSW